MPKPKTFSIITLGCFRNTYDSQTVVQRFLDQGYSLLPNSVKTDVALVNTCGFITAAKKESIAAISFALNLKKQKQTTQVQVFGCLVQRYSRALKKAFPEVDRWWGVEDFGSQTNKARLTPSYTAFVKITEGCANRCAYCAIPLIKGSLHSRPAQDILEEIKRLNDCEIKEINLIGQDITAWGLDNEQRGGIADLVKNIVKAAPNVPWIRLMYTHPRHVNEALIEVISKYRQICRYLDLPIQHINDRILTAMNRGVNRGQIEKIITVARKKIPGLAMRTSVIVGFPGETQAEFDELMEFLRNTRFERLGAFVYSREEATLAAKMKPQIPYVVRQKRYRLIMEQQARIAENQASRFIGKTMPVLIEEKNGLSYVGRTQYDAFEVDAEVIVNALNLKIGQIYKVKIIDSIGYDLIGKL